MKKILSSKKKNYSFIEAFSILKEQRNKKFIEAIDISVHLNLNPKKKNLIVKGHSFLNKKLKKNLNLAVFLTEEENFVLEKKYNVVVFTEKNINDITEKKINFDLILTSPISITKMGKLHKILGSKDLMPDIKYGTITNDINSTIDKINKGYVKFKSDKNSIINKSIGHVEFTELELKNNLETLISDIKKFRPQNCKNLLVSKIYLSSTMGKALEINLNSLNI
jgi:large subunit ribosomal protein L1